MAIYGCKNKDLFRFLAALRQRSFYIELTLFMLFPVAYLVGQPVEMRQPHRL